MHLFRPTEPLEFVAIDILELLPRTKIGNQFVVVMTNRFSKLTEAIWTTKTTATTVATIFINDWVANYGIPSKIMTDNSPQLTSKFFQEICVE